MEAKITKISSEALSKIEEISQTKRDLERNVKPFIEKSLSRYYIKSTSKPYSSNYYSLNGNYIKYFGICDLDKDEINFVINEHDINELDNFFERKYDVKL